MALFSKLPPQQQAAWNKWKTEREDQLLRQIDETSARAAQYLVLTNGGSAVALAAFMGASSRVQASALAWVAQQAFLVGLVLAGLLIGFRFHYFTHLFDSLKEDIHSVYSDRLDVDAVHANDDKRGRYSWIGAALAYLSFACFLWGAFNAAYRLPAAIN